MVRPRISIPALAIIAAITTYSSVTSAQIKEEGVCDWENAEVSGRAYNVKLDGTISDHREQCDNSAPPSDPSAGPLPQAQLRLMVQPFNEATRYAMFSPLRFRMLIGPLPTFPLSTYVLASIPSAEPVQGVACPNKGCSAAPAFGPWRRSILLAYHPNTTEAVANHRISLYEQMHWAESVNTNLGTLDFDLPSESVVSVASGTYAQVEVEYIYQFGSLAMKICSVATSSTDASSACSDTYYSNAQYYGFGMQTPNLWLGTWLTTHPQMTRVRYCRFRAGGYNPVCDVPM